jgi:2'-5' RNA ligase
MPNTPMPVGLDTPDLECVMLDVDDLPISAIYGRDLDHGDYFFGPNSEPKLKYAQGPVAEGDKDRAHLTLLFGIHPSKTYVDDVMNALGDWTPDDIFVQDVTHFPSNVGGHDYNAIVAKVMPTTNLLLARKRLETLPFTDQFARDYQPHITLAYIKGEADLEDWKRRMSAYFKGRVLYPTALNLGLDDE